MIEFQTDEHSAPIVSSTLHEANIPMIAIDIPHPGATYYGANNYRAGLIGGRFLGRRAVGLWKSQVPEVILLELPMAGALPRSRLMGMLAGIRESIPELKDHQITFLNGNGQYGHSLDVVRKHLAKRKSTRMLVGAVNDPSSLGALTAVRESGRLEDCLIMGQNASIEARKEIRNKDSRLVGSVAYFPESYGEGVISLALDLLLNKPTPPAVFVKHQLITRENIDRWYPNDSLIGDSDEDSLLFSSR